MRHLLPQSFRTTEWIHTKQHKVKIKASGMVIPHPEKVQEGMKAVNRNGRGLGGEDAFFYVFGKYAHPHLCLCFHLMLSAM